MPYHSNGSDDKYRVDRQRRVSTHRTSKSGALGVCRNNSVPRDHTSRDQADYSRRLGRQSSVTDLTSTVRQCGCPFHHDDSFASINHSSTFLSRRTKDRYVPPEPLYAHASSMPLPLPPEVVSTANREAAVVSDDGRSLSGSSVDSCIVGRDGSRDHSQPDIVTRHARTEVEMASRWRCRICRTSALTVLSLREPFNGQCKQFVTVAH